MPSIPERICAGGGVSHSAEMILEPNPDAFAAALITLPIGTASQLPLLRSETTPA